MTFLDDNTAELLAGLTPAQREAVTHMDGPMLVIAGAGSGKTRVVTRRIAHLIARGVWPDQILAMTFTNKAAGEMRERVASLVGATPRWLGTFHSLCARLLRQYVDKLGTRRTGDFTILDTADQEALLKQSIQALTFGEDKLKPRRVLATISRAKTAMLAPDDLPAERPGERAIALLYADYERRLEDMNGVDFDDLLLLTVQLLRERPDVRDICHSRFPYILVDEYQDTNRLQYELLRLLAGPARNVHATGDPDQSIYSWRGAEYRNIMDFTRDFPDTRVVRLEQNYRSTQTILDAANSLIRHNPTRLDKDLFTENDAGVPVQIVRLESEQAEAYWVAEQTAVLRAQGYRLRDMAVFYRTNAQSRPFEEVLMRTSIPYQIVGGIRFYERKEVKDLLAHLKILVNPRDSVSLQRIVNCRATGIGAKTLLKLVECGARLDLPVFTFLQRDDVAAHFGARLPAKLQAFVRWCRELAQIPRQPVAECAHRVLLHSGLTEHYEAKSDSDPATEERIENMDALVDRAMEFDQSGPDGTLPAFLEEVSLVADVDSWKDGGDTLTLMTLHSSKGLEFPCVFVVGAEEGLLPHENSLRTPTAVEEERRLLYVGLTRARKQAAVTLAASRFIYGESGDRQPSRFLSEFARETVEVVDAC